ncbi:T9SS type A sorting domain-containing protein [Flavobacterium luteum]|uniref:T9SS type A sorting domain-containing protein n=1 Tax=Flavobacterium luteum TaxID=2026654 RepID=UPI00177BA8BB|nr:T9SS type A sorting domain-containing protein [Flavobacterium luteum]
MTRDRIRVIASNESTIGGSNRVFQESNIFTYVSNELNKITIKGVNSFFELNYQVGVPLNNNSFAFKDLQVTPNLLVDVLTIKSNKIFTKVSIYNILGQEVLRQKGNGLELKLDLSHLISGNYFVKVVSDAKQQVFKVVKQ